MLDVSLPVMMHQHVDNFFKQVRLLWAKEASSNLVNGLFQLRQAVVVLLSMISEEAQQKRGEKKHTIRGKQKHMPVAVVPVNELVAVHTSRGTSRFLQGACIETNLPKLSLNIKPNITVRGSLPLPVKCIYIIHPHAKDKEVVLASLLSHLNIGSIHGTDGQRAVQHELHVASSRGLSASCRDLL